MNSDEFDHMLPDRVTLTHEERQFLMDIIDTSLRVCKRHHFFSWTQGLVQMLLPHEILVCGMRTGKEAGMHMLRFSSSRYFNDEHFSAVCAPDTGLLRWMMRHWESIAKPCLIGAKDPEGEHDPRWLELLKHHELRNAVMHGIRAADGSIKSYFCFSRVPEPFPPRLSYFLEVLLPYMDATLSRVLAHERESGNLVRTQSAITGREAQILRWIKDGHTNTEIAAILEISPHTVKNHVRKILIKLGVQTRAHAAVKAIQLGVLKIGNDY